MKLSTDISKTPTHEEGEPIEVDIGPWRVEHEFARGGMGIVYRAHHHRSKVPAAIKMMTWTRASDPQYRKRFEDEVRSAAKLSHPGIIDIYDYGDLADWEFDPEESGLPPTGPYLAMELARHGGLHQRNSAPNWAVCRGIIAGVLDSLAHAHARDVIHRDLKPANILFGRDTNQQLRVKLSDFGLAFVFESLPNTNRDEALTGGTPTYMAPEQFRSNWREYGAWTDLYGLGCVAWELICGEPPYSGDSPLELAVQHTKEDLPAFEPLIDVPDGTEEWLHRMLAKEPADRFRYAADALRQLPSTGTEKEAIGIRLLDDPEAAEPSDPDNEAATYPTLGSLAQSGSEPIEMPDDFSPMVSFDQLSEDEKKVGETGARSIPDPPDYELPEDWRPPEMTDDLPPAKRHEMTAVGLELASLRDVPVVGRGDERDEIWKSFLDTLATKDRHRIAITGSLGIGKSRLARWARERTQELGLAQGLKVQWPKDGRDTESTGLSRMLRDVLNTDGASSEAAAERIERWFERHPSPDTGEGATIAPLIDDTPRTNRTKHTLTHVVAGVLNWLVVDPPIRYRRVRLRTPDQKAAVAARFIERMAARRPVVLQIDDPHTEEANAFLRELRTIQQPMLGIVTADTSRFADDEDLQDRLDNVCQKRIELEPLSEQNQKFLVSRLLSVSPALTNEIIRQTDGNPRLAIDTIAAWAAHDQLEPGPEGFELTESAEPQISDNITDTVRSHIDPILRNEPESVVRGAEIGAAGGTHIDTRDWQDVCKFANLPYPEGLIDSLSRERILDRNGPEWHFTNALARQLLLDRAREGDRLADYHSVWADICKEREAHPERIADHLIQAGRLREALDPLVEAMNVAGWRSELSSALRSLHQLEEIVEELDLPEDHPAKIEYHLGRVREIISVRADYDVGLEHANCAIEGAKHLESDALLGDAYVQRFRVALRSDDPDLDARQNIDRAFSYLNPKDHPSRWAGAVTSVSTHLVFNEGEVQQAYDFVDSHLEQLDHLPARSSVKLLLAKARAACHLRNFDTCLETLEKGIELAHAHDLVRIQLQLFNIAGTVYVERNELDRAEKLIKETLKLARSEPSITASVLELTFGDILLQQGKIRQAHEHFSQLPSVTQEQLRKVYPVTYLGLAATAACRLQFWDEAEPYLEDLLDYKDSAESLMREQHRILDNLLDAARGNPDQQLIQKMADAFQKSANSKDDQSS